MLLKLVTRLYYWMGKVIPEVNGSFFPIIKPCSQATCNKRYTTGKLSVTYSPLSKKPHAAKRVLDHGRLTRTGEMLRKHF